MSKFRERVLEIVDLVPKGKVASYGQIALFAGVPKAARQVGTIMLAQGEDHNWWRIINNAGRISIKNPEVTPDVQKTLLEKDGVFVSDKYKIDIEKYRWRPDLPELKTLELDEEYIQNILDKYLY